jgi:hypothetical protein
LFQDVGSSKSPGLYKQEVVNTSYQIDRPVLFSGSDPNMDLDVVFTTSCLYNPGLLEDPTSWNKLYGISFGLDPLKSGVLIGWRHNGDGLIDIGVVVNNNGYRNDLSHHISSIPPEEVSRMSLKYEPPFIWVSCGSVRIPIDLSEVNTSAGKIYRAGPWFGGTSPAPNKMIIKIKES